MIKFNMLDERFVQAGDKGVKLDQNIHWKDHLSDSDIVAASEFLNLTMPRHVVDLAVKKLIKHKTRIEWYKAKDILRASGLTPLDASNYGIQKKLDKIKNNVPLTPCILVLYKKEMIIADGFHRVSSLYSISETERVACVLIHVDND